MPLWKQLLLSGYLAATLPARWQAARKRTATQSHPVSILFYHRVANQHPNGWTIRCDRFQQQMEWIAKRYQVISLAEAQQRIAQGGSSKPAVCITFDDGYADNCEFALPLLLRMGLPFTYFVSTHHMQQQLPFPHDVQAGVKLRPNTPEEIQMLAQAGVEIGAHTRTHPDIGKIQCAQQLQGEIAGSRQDLQQLTGQSIDYFAFPFGLHPNMTAEACRVVFQAGFKGFCSAYGAYNWPGADAFHLRRMHGDPELVRLKNWLTIDPRRRAVEDFDPQDYRSATILDPEVVHGS